MTARYLHPLDATEVKTNKIVQLGFAVHNEILHDSMTTYCRRNHHEHDGTLSVNPDITILLNISCDYLLCWIFFLITWEIYGLNIITVYISRRLWGTNMVIFLFCLWVPTSVNMETNESPFTLWCLYYWLVCCVLLEQLNNSRIALPYCINT